MRFIKKTLCAALFIILSFTTIAAFAQNIRFEGLQRISRETALSYLPNYSGGPLSSDETTLLINRLYETGFFKDISVSQVGNTLVIKVVERAVIGSVQVTGNKEIEKDKLNTALKDFGLVEGQVFDPAVLEKVQRSLQLEYYNRGRYNATVVAKVIPEARHRVSIKIEISEGRIAAIQQITIIGNKAFSSKALLKALPLSTGNLFSFFTHDNQYSEMKLEEAKEALRSYYLDRGYIKFSIDSVQTSLSPDRKGVYIVFRVTEGPLYTVKGFKLEGRLLIPEERLRKLVAISPGSVFSRKAVVRADKAIGRAFGNQGYVFANINAVPTIDEATKQVELTFYIDPGQRVYVRRISFSGHTKTLDEVLRRESRQMEGGLASSSQIQQTVRRLDMLGYLQKTQVQTLPVPEASDQVDLNFKVTETASGSARAGIGYGSAPVKFLFNLSLEQKSFMGTGKDVRIAFDRSQYYQSYNFTYNNPYYTIDGIGRGFNVYSQRTDLGKANIANYSLNSWGGRVFYTIPISNKDDSIQLGFGYQHMRLNTAGTPSLQIQKFAADYKGKTNFGQILLEGGWTRNGFNRAMFPSRGLNQNFAVQLSAPAGSNSLKYYKASYNAKWYFPFNRHFILTASGGVGYGGGYGSSPGLPFFQNYFAGGLSGGPGGTVRGYETNTLGPFDSNARPLGGNFMVSGSIGLIFPNFINPDKMRTTAFVDAGNVYNTRANPGAGINGIPPAIPGIGSNGAPLLYANRDAGPVRYSAGIGVEWHIPVVGLLNFSLATPLNKQPGDRTEFFQFTFGRAF